MRNFIFLICIFCSHFLNADKQTYVTCKFFGELGNQMFEVANAVAYGLDHECEPVFWGFQGIVNGELNWRHVFHRLKVIPNNHNIHFEDCHQKVPLYQFMPLPPPEGNNLRFIGHFVNEKYFLRHKEYIQKLFAPTDEILARIHRKYRDLLKQPTVAVHVRTFIRDHRNPQTDGFAGASWDYFVQAMSHFSEDHTFLVFSDDPQWTRKHFPIKSSNIHFIEGNPHYIDLYFMSLCDHQIISPDSSFSWWAAWLNLNPNKIVIAPHFWYLGYTGEDAFPPEWIRIYAKSI